MLPDIKEIHLYFMDSPDPFPYILPFQDVQNGQGITLSNGNQFLISVHEENPYILRIVNLYSDAMDNQKYGKIVGVKYVYIDGQETWAEQVVAKGFGSTTNSYDEHLNTALGDWVNGKTINQVLADSRYQSAIPYIGYTESWVEFKIGEPHEVTVPDPGPIPEPQPCGLSLMPNTRTILIGEMATFTANHSNTSGIQSYQWVFDEGAFTIHVKNENTLTISPLLSGSYSIQIQVEYADRQICTATATLIAKVPETTQQPTEPSPPTEPQDPDSSNSSEGVNLNVKLTKPYNPIYRYPNSMKRNARYRGQRESEKVLSSQQELAYDVRQIWKEINEFTNLQDITINGFFQGESEKTAKKIMISIEKTFTANPNQERYPLTTSLNVSNYDHVVVKLDQVNVDPSQYTIDQNDLVINVATATDQPSPKELTVSCVANILVEQDRVIGIETLKERLRKIDERIEAAKRRYDQYENAYQ